MAHVKEGTLLWKPNEAFQKESNLFHYQQWLQQHKQLHFTDYHDLWQWSVNHLEAFWESIWEYTGMHSTTPYENVLSTHTMPGAEWFQGAMVNYTEHIFRERDSQQTAIIHASESRTITEVTWGKLYRDTAALQHTLKQLGVKKGDRVVAYVPNIYEAVVAFLATASLGAIWSSASPDFGTQSVIDRFKQIEPKIMLTIDGYRYNGKPFDRQDIVEDIQSALPSLKATIVIPYLYEQINLERYKNGILWFDAVPKDHDYALTYEHVPFNDPLWILFSSGTTGIPKPIVHSQGGILLEHLKALTLHVDLDENSRFFWYTTTGWMMWNFLVGGLLTGSTIILYDGSPVYPHQEFLWEFAEKTNMTVFGTSASYITECMKQNMSPRKKYQLDQLKCVSSTGSPLPPEGFKWCYDHIKEDLWIASVSGGTDVCTAFILGSPTLPVYAGELQCRGLGAKIESFSDTGEALINEVGELVLTKPFPSMPIYFWNDKDGSRLKDSYFDVYPGIWRHGDYLKITHRHSCIIYGRSDATINRGGIRIGTSEIYRAIDAIKEVADSIIVDVPVNESESSVLLFVMMQKGETLTDHIKDNIKQQIRSYCSPRHVPNGIYQIDDIPKTLNGKKLEVPVKKILMGEDVERVVNKGSLANPQALDYFIKFRKSIKNGL